MIKISICFKYHTTTFNSYFMANGQLLVSNLGQ